MNSKLYNIATATAKVLAVLTGLAAYQDVIPAKFLPVAGLVFAVASSLKEVVRVVRDWSDDGQLNNSARD